MFFYQLIINLLLFFMVLNISWLISLKNKPKLNLTDFANRLYWPLILAIIFTVIDYLRLFIFYKIILVIVTIFILTILLRRK